MIKLGVFILPDKFLKSRIVRYKKLIKKNYGNQKYLSHLPHCTLCVLNVSKNLIKNIKKEKLVIEKIIENLRLKVTTFFTTIPLLKVIQLYLK